MLDSLTVTDDNMVKRVMKVLKINKIRPNEVYITADNGFLAVELEGDWKHEHLACDTLLSKYLGLEKVSDRVLSDDGSDNYTAIRYFSIPTQSHAIPLVKSPVSLQYTIDFFCVRDMCIREHFYTAGTNDDYEALASFCKGTRAMDATLDDAVYSVAVDICYHSTDIEEKGYKSFNEMVLAVVKMVMDEAVFNIVAVD